MRKTRNDAIPVLLTFQDFHKRTYPRAGVEYVALAQDPFQSRTRKTHSAGRFSPRQPQNLEVLRLLDSILLVFRLNTSSNRENTPYFFPRLHLLSKPGATTVEKSTRRLEEVKRKAVTELIRSGTAISRNLITSHRSRLLRFLVLWKSSSSIEIGTKEHY